MDSYSGDLIFVFDQWNALETGLSARAHEDIKDIDKVRLRKILLEMSSKNQHRLIIGSSVNNLTIASTLLRYRNDCNRIFSLTGGLTRVCLL